MALYEIPVFANEETEDYTMQITIEDINFRMDCYWVARNESWHMDIYQAEGDEEEEEEILMGAKLTLDNPVGFSSSAKLSKYFIGFIIPIRTSVNVKTITRENFGTDVLLYYDDGVT